MIGDAYQFEDLQALSGYKRAADVEKWARDCGISVKRASVGVWTTLDALNHALGVTAANRDTYAPDAVV